MSTQTMIDHDKILDDPTATLEDLQAALHAKFGDCLGFDPSDPEANRRARAAGVRVVGGSDLTKAQWTNIKRFKGVSLVPTGRSAYKSDVKPVFDRKPRVPRTTVIASTGVDLPEVEPMATVTNPSEAEELSKLVPPRSVFETYVPRGMDGMTDYEIVKTAVLNGRNVLLQSDAGAGKNHLAAAVAAELRCPIISISLSGGATTEDIIGASVFVGGEQGTVWVDGFFTWFWRLAVSGQRVIIVLDEVNACPNDILFRLHQSLDERRALVLAEKGRESLVDAMKNCAVIATMNPDYLGTKPLNQAFKRRFQVKLTLDYDKVVEKRLLRRAGMESDKTEKLLDLAVALRAKYHDTDLSQPLGTADLLNYVANVTLFGEHIARHSLLQNYEADEQAAVLEAIRLHLDGAVTSTEDAGL